MPMSATLTDIRTGREYQLRPDGTTLGRHRDNEVSLPGRAVSRFHAEIGLGGEGWFLEDHGSTYGTFVNGQRVEGTVALKDGDSIRVAVTSAVPDGEFNFTFRAGKEGVATKVKTVAKALVGRKRAELGSSRVEKVGEAVVLRLEGIFRRREVDVLSGMLSRELSAGQNDLLLDLSAVSYLNSYGLSCLVSVATRQRERGRFVRAFGARGTVLKLLCLVGSESPIEICETEDEALRRA
jgi:anti-anti-sigma factor